MIEYYKISIWWIIFKILNQNWEEVVGGNYDTNNKSSLKQPDLKESIQT